MLKLLKYHHKSFVVGDFKELLVLMRNSKSCVATVIDCCNMKMEMGRTCCLAAKTLDGLNAFLIEDQDPKGEVSGDPQ